MGESPISPTYNGYIIVKFDETASPGDAVLISRELGVKIERLFRNASRSTYEEERAQLETVGDRRLPDLNHFFRLKVNDPQVAETIILELKGTGLFESIHAESRIIPAAAINTPDLEPQQDFLEAMHIHEARDYDGGYGENSFIIDCESTGNLSHEDVQVSEGIIFGSASTYNYQDHATAIWGILTGKDDGHGVTGVAPGAKLGSVNWYSGSPAAAIDAARLAMKPGDVLLLEGQTAGPPSLGACSDKSEDGCVPVEYNPAIFAAIEYAVASGIIVVECAGNGGNNLDSSIFNGAFDPFVKHSGAIIVGAGNGATHWPTIFTNYGSRVDLQGIGTSVTTSGYGDLFNCGINRRYTSKFSGTSPAAAMVAGAIAILQSIHKEAFPENSPLTAEDVLNLLHETGAEQGGTKHIGPLPDVDKAAESMLGMNSMAYLFQLINYIVHILPRNILCSMLFYISGTQPKGCK